MKRSQKSGILLSAILAAIPAMAFGQYRVGDDGHASDANNRIGSGGYNSGNDASMRPYGATGNQMVTGNSTGLSYFHGNVPYNDPNVSDAASSSSASDRFLAISGPVNYAQRTTGASPYQPTYDANRLTAPAPIQNYTVQPGTNQVLPGPPITNQPNDTRLGIINSVQTDTSLLPAPGELDLPGPVDASGNASALTASPLYGIRQWSPNDASDAYFLSRYTNVRQEGPSDRGRLDNASILRMRSELNGTMVQPDGQPNPAGGNQTSPVNGTANPANPNTGGAGALPPGSVPPGQQIGSTSLGSPTNPALSQQPLSASVSNPALAANVGGADQGIVQRMLIPPEQQSDQIAELERRYQQNKAKMSGQQANQLYNHEQEIIQQAKDQPAATDKPAAGQPGTIAVRGVQPGAQPDVIVPPDYARANQELMSKATTQPLNPMIKGPLTDAGGQSYVITSLATGIRGKGLADLMKSAEDQMRQGKFTNALDTYDSAQQVAPNNPLILVGRGIAELGASYYGKAEADLRRAFTAEPAVLVGQYDLKGFLGEDRLKFVVKDLKGIADTEKSARPVFLLAYLTHNVGDDESATKYLNEADRRSGGKDPVVDTMRTTWGLGSGDK